MLKMIFRAFLISMLIPAVSSADNEWPNRTEVCQYLQRLGIYANNSRVNHFLTAACLNLYSSSPERNDSNKNAVRDSDLFEQTISDWLLQAEKPTLTPDLCAQEIFFPLQRLSNTTFVKRLQDCFCLETCDSQNHSVAKVLAKRIARLFLTVYFYHKKFGSAEFKEQPLNSSDDGFQFPAKTAIKQGLNCPDDENFCCFLYYDEIVQQPQRHKNFTDLRLETYGEGGTPKEAHHQTAAELNCLLDIFVAQQYDESENEQCLSELAGGEGQDDQETDTAKLEACQKSGLNDNELRYQLAYSELGILEMLHFAYNRHIELCEGNSVKDSCPIEISKHTDKAILQTMSGVLKSMIPVDLIILLLNGLLYRTIVGAHRNGKGSLNSGAAGATTNKTNRALIFLGNAAFSNVIFAIIDLVSITWTLADVGLRQPQDSQSLITPDLVHCYCCTAKQSLQPVWTFTARLTHSYHAVISAVLIGCRLICQCVSLLTFVGFGLFQVLPLLRPLSNYWCLRHPHRVRTGIWCVAISLFVIVIGINSHFYFDVKHVLKSGVMSAPENRHEAHAEDKFWFTGSLLICNPIRDVINRLYLLRTATAAEVITTLVLLVCGELASAAIIGVVLFVRFGKTKIRSTATPSVQSRQKSMKGIVTVGTTQTLAFISAFPMLVLWYDVQMSAWKSDTSSENEAYTNNAIGFVRFYLVSRAVLLVEPLLSPILILVRFESLAEALLTDLRLIKLRAHATVQSIRRSLTTNSSVIRSESSHAAEGEIDLPLNNSSIPTPNRTSVTKI